MQVKSEKKGKKKKKLPDFPELSSCTSSNISMIIGTTESNDDGKSGCATGICCREELGCKSHSERYQI